MAELVRLVMVGGTGAIPAFVRGRRAFLLSHSSPSIWSGEWMTIPMQVVDNR